MAKFNLNLRDAGATTETPIHLVARWNNQKLVIKTGYSANPAQWDKDKQRLKTTQGIPNRLTNKQINAKLAEIVSTAESQFVKFETQNDRQPSVKEYGDILKTEFDFAPAPAKNLGLFDFMEQHLKEMSTGINPKSKRPYAVATLKTYRQCITHLRAYATTKKKKLDFDSIDLDFYHSYVEYLTNEGFKTNHIGKLIKMLKTFLNEAIERGLTNNIHHKKKRFIAPREQVSNIYLTLEELQGLWNLDFSKEPRLENVRDLFIFGCYTGLRFSDFTKVKSQNIDLKEGLIDIRTQKTDEMVSVPILPITRAIIKKYEGKTANSLPVSISNQRFNEYLKEVAERFTPLHETITKETTVRGHKVTQTLPKWQLVTTHTARRSFATNMFKEGFPAQTIMKITGHRTEASFMTYLKLSPREYAKTILRDWESKFAISQ
jgi:integrase